MIDWSESLIVGGAVDADATELPIALVAVLGIEAGTHEIVHVVEREGVQPWRVRRAQAGTTALDWPAGTALTYLPPGQHPSQSLVTLTLRQPIAAGDVWVDTHDSYQRGKIGSEIVHVTYDSGRLGERLDCLRGREGTAAASHSSGSAFVWLGPGEV